MLTVRRNGGACDLYHRLGFHRHVQLFAVAAMPDRTRKIRSLSEVTSGAKKGVVGRTINMCLCDVGECRTSRVPVCPCRDLLVSVQSVCRTGARVLFLEVDSSLTSACMDIVVFQKAMSKSNA